MDPIYLNLRRIARRIATRYPVPDFYRDCFREYEYARRVLRTDPLVTDLMACVGDVIEDDFGHGVHHALKVAEDGGALMLLETGCDESDAADALRSIQVVQAAALLHDIRRKVKNHAVAGADAARPILARFQFSAAEVQTILYAIRSHEAFRPLADPPTPEAERVSNCLYDADKFRWGPDNFIDTVWEMTAFTNPPLSEFVRRYPAGIRTLRRIRTTFRSRTGRRYGPQFIDFGIAIGEELLKIILRDYGHLL